MAVDRVLADRQVFGDRLVAHAVPDQGQDLDFPWRECAGGLA